MERLLTTASSTQILLDAALEEIPTAAFIVGDQGSVLEASLAGRAWLDREGVAGRRVLRETVRGASRPMPSRFRVTPVRSPGVASRSLVVRTRVPYMRPHLRRAGSRWGFSAREMTVMEHLADGRSNRTIAAELGVVERTVEAHLTRMFGKAQVESRAELVAKAWLDGR